MADSKSQLLVDGDMKRLHQMLQIAAPSDQIHRQDAGETRILDLACGACHEARVLVDHFGTPVDSSKKRGQVKLVGVDVRGREIDEARDQFQGDRSNDFLFFEGDARGLKDHRELPGEFDVVFMRHQNYWDHAEVWKEIFDHGLEKLHHQGMMVITSYFEREHQLAVEAIQRLGGNLVTEIDNPEARSLATHGKRIDQRIAVFRKS